MNLQRSRAARALLVIVSTALSVLVLEAACQVYVLVFLADTPLPRGEFQAKRPLPFQRADSLSADFLREAGGIGKVPAASGSHRLLEDVAGHYVNVVNGLRRTTNQPPQPERRLLVFGGSTVLSEEVPDQ